MSHDPLPGISSQTAPLSRDSLKLPPKAASREADFAGSLARETARGQLKFSAHATRRLVARNITLTSDDLARVERATQLAAGRGSRDALLMMDNLGLIVNIKNRTVLTALDLKQAGDGIVTNIDSTVVVRK